MASTSSSSSSISSGNSSVINAAGSFLLDISSKTKSSRITTVVSPLINELSDHATSYKCTADGRFTLTLKKPVSLVMTAGTHSGSSLNFAQKAEGTLSAGKITFDRGALRYKTVGTIDLEGSAVSIKTAEEGTLTLTARVGVGIFKAECSQTVNFMDAFTAINVGKFKSN